MKNKVKPKQQQNDDESQSLQAPLCPQSENGVIDVGLVTGNILVRVPPYYNMVGGDIITVFFGEISSQLQIVPYDTALGQYIDFPFYKDLFDDGDYDIWYHAQDIEGNLSAPSEVLHMTLINTHPRTLPTPIFPQSCNGELDAEEIAAAQYTTTVMVQQSDILNGYVQALILAENVLIIGKSGKGTGQYDMYPYGLSNPHYYRSLATSVLLWQKVDTALRLDTTTGAVVRHDSYPYLLPCNYSVVFGQPGSKVSASVSPQAIIADTHAVGNVTQFVLDESGKYSFGVYLPYQQGDGEAVQVQVYQEQHPDNLVTSIMSFLPYRVGRAGVHAYSYTTRAINDLTIPNSVYLIANEGIFSLVVAVSGSALINGWTQQLILPLHIDGTTTINIVNSVAETVTIAMHTDSADLLQFTVVFIDQYTSQVVSESLLQPD